MPEASFLQAWFNWKDERQKEDGITIGLDYTTTALTTDDALPGADEEAAGGIGRVFGTWRLTSRNSGNTGTIVYRVAHHHAYTDTAPQDFAPENIGYAGLAYTQWDDAGTKLGHLHWRQVWGHGRTVLVAGYQDVADFLDVYALADPWKHMLNLAFLTGAGTVSLPSSGALGVSLGTWINQNIYVQGGVIDANADATDTGNSFETFFQDREYFYHFEIGLTTSKSRAYLDNVHLSLWRADERDDAGVDDAWGAAFSASYWFHSGLLPFLKAGYSEDGSSLLESSVSLGLGYQPQAIGQDMGNLLMLAANWSEPNKAVFGEKLGDQHAIEASFRWQMSRELAITPNLQFLKDPALADDQDHAWLVGFRRGVRACRTPMRCIPIPNTGEKVMSLGGKDAA